MRLLQEAGMPAGVMQNADALYCCDPQLKERGFFVELPHPEIGPSRIQGVPIKLTDGPGAFERPGPVLGGHNDYVLRDLLGLSENEVNELMGRRII
jgi:CoA:oxalate CoA-transferase